MTDTAPLRTAASTADRPRRERLFGDQPWQLVAALAAAALVAESTAVVAGAVVAFGGWLGSEPAPAGAYVAFLAGITATAAVAVAYLKAARAPVPGVLMLVTVAANMVPLFGALLAVPCAVLAVATSFVGPIVRMRHKKTAALAALAIATALAVTLVLDPGA